MALLKLHRDAEVFDLGGGKRRFVTGGGIYNPEPFDGGPRARGTFVFADGIKQGNWTWLGKGEQGYLVKPSTGTARVYPVKGDQSKYIQISGLADKVCEINQIDDQNLEIFVDKPNTRWSLKMGPQGFKPEIILKSGWAGTPEWQFRFELNGGLTLEGAWIMDGDTQVLKMHNPYLIDATGKQRAVAENFTDGVITLTADLSGLVYPIVVDPTLGPIGNNKDGILYLGAPTTGFGQFQNVEIYSGTSPNTSREAWLWDISAISPSAIVTSADMALLAKLYVAPGQSLVLYRCIRTDWEDVSGVNNEANWLNYKDPAVPWTTAGGDRDLSISDTYTTSAALNNLETISIINNAQDAVTNRSGIISMIHGFVTEGSGNYLVGYHSLESITPAARPKLTVVYTEPVGAAFNRSRIVNMGASGPQNRSTIANA